MKKNNRFLTLVRIAFLVLCAPLAHAGGPLALCANGQPYVWANGGANIPFNPDLGNLGPLTNAQAVAAVQASFDVWTAVGSSTVSYTNAGPLPVDVDINNFVSYYDAPAPDGLSAIVFDDTGEIFELLFGADSGVLGFAGPEWGNSTTCTITEGLSFLNGPAFDDLTAAKDVMVHEFGHYTNLAHTVVNGQIYLGSIGGDNTGPTPFSPYAAPDPLATDVVETMYPFYYGPGIGTQTLHRDDIATVSALYPAPSFPTTTGTIAGTILASNGVTKLTGVNVIARNEADPFQDAVSAISSDYTEEFEQTNPLAGTYTLYGLTPGAKYRVYVDEILAGGFSTPPAELPGPEEYASAGAESNNQTSVDPPEQFALITPGATGVNVVFNSPRAGDPLPVGDDGSFELVLPFAFGLCNQTFNSVFVNANGNLTFGAGSSDTSESAGELLNGAPRIAAWWRDLSPFSGTGAPQGIVTFAESQNDFTVIFRDVPEYPNTGANSFSIKLFRDRNHGGHDGNYDSQDRGQSGSHSGNIQVKYEGMTAVAGIAGVSCGNLVTAGNEPASDLSTLRRSTIELNRYPAVYEVFTSANPNDLANTTLRYNGKADYNDNWAEPNNSLRKARQIALPFSSANPRKFTEIAPAGADVDFYRFEASAGDAVIAEIVSSALDTVIVLMDARGNVIAQDDDSGTGLLSKIATFVPRTGKYFLGVSTVPDTDFTGDGEGTGRYVLNVQTADRIVINAGDDSSHQIGIPFSFPFQGQNRSSVFVNSNGNLTFGAGSTDFSESVSDLLSGPPRIAALWDDLSPNQGGEIFVEANSASWTVTYVDVPQYQAGDGNSFSITLSVDGGVTISYGDVAALDGIVGITQGAGAGSGESDLSAATSLSATGTTYEEFTGAADAFDLDGALLPFEP